MKFRGTIGDAQSGSLAGITASHNRGGPYWRERVVPVNSNTPQQQAVRNFFSQLAAAWGGTLTQAQRDAWETYATNSPRTDSLGNVIILPALAMYQACNVGRLQAGLDRVDDGPTTFGLTDLGTITVTSFSEASQELTLGFDNTDTWAGAVGGGLLVSISRPVSPTIRYFKGPYRFADVVPGAASPPTSPATIAAPFPFVAGQQLYVKAVATDVEGRPSSTFRGGIVAVA